MRTHKMRPPSSTTAAKTPSVGIGRPHGIQPSTNESYQPRTRAAWMKAAEVLDPQGEVILAGEAGTSLRTSRPSSPTDNALPRNSSDSRNSSVGPNRRDPCAAIPRFKSALCRSAGRLPQTPLSRQLDLDDLED